MQRIFDADGGLVCFRFHFLSSIIGRWLYTWDAENRLVSMETRPDINTNVPQTQLDFAYDYLGRRISKVVDGTTNTFIYDGWNLISETHASITPIRQSLRDVPPNLCTRSEDLFMA